MFTNKSSHLARGEGEEEQEEEESGTIDVDADRPATTAPSGPLAPLRIDLKVDLASREKFQFNRTGIRRQ